MIEADRCRRCGWPGLVPHGYRNGRPTGYILIATCPNCSWSEER